MFVKLGTGAKVQPRYILRFSSTTSLQQVGSFSQNKLLDDSVLIKASQVSHENQCFIYK